MGKIYRGQRLPVKSRKELLATIKQPHWKFLRPDNGDLPDGWSASPNPDQVTTRLKVFGARMPD